ncbi:MAG: histidine kinase [Cryomorphaceae bacterium]|nr:histidine kinase [Cryomorphaceae bacterium]
MFTFINKAFWNRQREAIIGSLMIGLVSSVFFLIGGDGQSVWKNGLLAFGVSFLIWSGNQELSCIAERRFPFETNPVRRIVLMVIVNLLWGLMVLFAAILLMQSFYEFTLDRGVILYTIYFGCFITLIINGGYIINFLISEWKLNLLEKEQLKNDRLQAELSALRMQMDPHFLFNSLTTLDQLIHEDTEKASQYLEQLANCYRYVLENSHEEAVEIERELQFGRDFLALLNVRFGENLQVIENTEIHPNVKLPVMTLQRLLENVVKHNVINRQSPMVVEVNTGADFFEVKNLINIKENTNGTGIGLKHLRDFYSNQPNEQLIISETDGWFVVRIEFSLSKK